MHVVLDVHDTLLRALELLASLTGLGIACKDHANPFQCSAITLPRSVVEPTAVQSALEIHDTPLRLPCGMRWSTSGTFGVGLIDHRVPFQ